MVSVSQTLLQPEPVVLLRGEDPALLAQLRLEGVRGRAEEVAPGAGFSLSELAMQDLDAELVAMLHADEVTGHVVNTSRDKATVSFTRLLPRALNFAFDGWKRHTGLLLVVHLQVARTDSWDAPDEWGCGGFVDTHGRRWLHAAGMTFPGGLATTDPERVREFRRRATRDGEFLLLDRLPPGTFEVLELQRRGQRVEIVARSR